MIIIYNFITLCKYLINNITGFVSVNYIEFEYIDKYDKYDENEPLCNCNLCYTFRNVIFFATRRLECKNV